MTKRRPKPEEPIQFCLGIDTRTYEIVRIFGKHDGSYTISGYSYGNQHGNSLEAEVMLIHPYISALSCVPMHLFNNPLIKNIEADLQAKANKMKEGTAKQNGAN